MRCVSRHYVDRHDENFVRGPRARRIRQKFKWLQRHQRRADETLVSIYVEGAKTDHHASCMSPIDTINSSTITCNIHPSLLIKCVNSKCRFTFWGIILLILMQLQKQESVSSRRSTSTVLSVVAPCSNCRPVLFCLPSPHVSVICRCWLGGGCFSSSFLNAHKLNDSSKLSNLCFNMQQQQRVNELKSTKQDCEGLHLSDVL